MPATGRQNLAESALTSRRFASRIAACRAFPARLAESWIGDDVCICFLHPFDLVNLCDYHIREGSFVCDRDEQNNIRPPETGVGLFDAGNALEYLQHIFRLSGFDFDEDIGFRCHYALPINCCVPPAFLAGVVQTPGGCLVPVA